MDNNENQDQNETSNQNIQTASTDSDSTATVSRVLKFVTGGLEALLGIPVLGGSIIVGLVWTPLVAMLVLHIITLVFTAKANKNTTGSILGIVASAVGWIPIAGMIMHILAAIFLLTIASKNE